MFVVLCFFLVLFLGPLCFLVSCGRLFLVGLVCFTFLLLPHCGQCWTSTCQTVGRANNFASFCCQPLRLGFALKIFQVLLLHGCAISVPRRLGGEGHYDFNVEQTLRNLTMLCIFQHKTITCNQCRFSGMGDGC